MSKSLGFTPGPWEVILNFSDGGESESAMIYGDDPNDKESMVLIADTCMDNPYINLSRETQTANANLIAAAPELYEALAVAVKEGRAGRAEWIDYAEIVLAIARGE